MKVKYEVVIEVNKAKYDKDFFIDQLECLFINDCKELGKYAGLGKLISVEEAQE